jgi:hypothetical protein
MKDSDFKNLQSLKQTYAKNREEKQRAYSSSRRIAESEPHNHRRLFWGYKRRNMQPKPE